MRLCGHLVPPGVSVCVFGGCNAAHRYCAFSGSAAGQPPAPLAAGAKSLTPGLMCSACCVQGADAGPPITLHKSKCLHQSCISLSSGRNCLCVARIQHLTGALLALAKALTTDPKVCSGARQAQRLRSPDAGRRLR